MRLEDASEIMGHLLAGRSVRIDGMVYTMRRDPGGEMLVCEVMGRDFLSDLSVNGLLRSSRWEVIG